MSYIVIATILTQVILESLPISSSAHVVLFHVFAQRLGSIIPLFSEGFNHLLHMPTIIVVALFVYQWHASLIHGINALLMQRDWKRFRWRIIWKGAWQTFMLLWVATGITIGMYYGKPLEPLTTSFVLHGGFLITAAALLGAGLRGWYEKKCLQTSGTLPQSPFTWWHALLLGCVQGVSLIPGLSRLGLTFAIGRIVGLRPRRALTISLLLQLILMIGAVVRALFSASKASDIRLLWTPVSFTTLVGGGILAYILLTITGSMAQKRRMWVFGVYLILLGGLCWISRIC